MSENRENNQPIILAWTGASGMQYGIRLLQCLLESDEQVYLLVSKAAQVVLAMETDIKLPAQPADCERMLTEYFNVKPGKLKVYGREQWSSPVASGSAQARAMVVCPCTMGTLSSISCGASENLIERAADVMLKEQRKLILVPRETPLSAIHLENMLKLAQLGVCILPANPGFYHKPASVTEVTDFVVARILDQLGISQDLLPRWGSEG